MEKNNKLIELKNIVVEFDGERVIDDMSLYIGDGEFVTLLGCSGCGKTTTLRVIAGFIQPQSGEVFFDSKNINGVPPYKRSVNTIFQRYALFPNYNVYDNIAFGLRVNKVPEKEIEQRVSEMLKLVNLQGFEKRSITKLSGGQQQRVAIARAVINRPKVLLLDEPLAALDLKLRKDMQKELKNIQRQLGITFIYVTHDQEEALSMSDTVVVMHEGKIQQIGKPVDIYNEPKNAFVADFIGESNIIDGVMEDDFKVKLDGKSFECLDKGFAKGEPVDVVIRPEDVDIVPAGQGMLRGVIKSVTFRGVHFEILIDVQDFMWMIQTTDEYKEGQEVDLKIDPDAIHIMKKSKYSGQFGDYSTYSDEMDALSEITEEDEE
ncbi:MAG: ABC transporter ATP-binding protein [Oscillospiraceae bacterium]|nr:ABC transporter ATP-binding protein [Oscillospiraceae bacterium]